MPEEEMFSFGPPMQPLPLAKVVEFPVNSTAVYRQGITFGANLILDQLPLLLEQIKELPIHMQLDSIIEWRERLKNTYREDKE